MATDYSAIARLPASVLPLITYDERQYGEAGRMGETRPVTRRIIDENALKADPRLAAYQSKFNGVEDLGDGRISVVLQQPGGDKYDLMKAVYALDPESGEYVLQGEPAKYREQSGLTSGLQMIGKAATPIVAAMSGGALAGALGGGILGGAGAGAALGAGGALAGGSNREGALKGAVGGAIAGGVMAGAQGQGWTGAEPPVEPMGPPESLAGSPELMGPPDSLANPAAPPSGTGLEAIPDAATGEPVTQFVTNGNAGTGTLGTIPPGPGPVAPLAAGGLLANAALPATASPAASVPDASFRPSQNYGPGMTGAQTSAFDSVLNATGSTGLAAAAGNVPSGLLEAGSSLLDGVIKAGSSIFNNNGLLGLIGAGVQQWNLERMAQETRDWQDKRESDARRRRAPTTMGNASIKVRKGVLSGAAS